MPGAVGHGDVAGGLGLAVDAKRAEGLVLAVLLARAVEHVVARDMHERDPVLGAGLGKQRRALGVGGPGGFAALGRLGGVDGGVGSAVDDGAVERPVDLGVVGGVGEVELVAVAEVEGTGDPPLLGELAHRAAELAVGAGDERAARRHGDGVLQHRMLLVGLGQLALVERDGPLDAELGVGEVDEGVGLLELCRPVGVHQVGVGRTVLERLEGVAHAARHVDGLGGVDDARVDLAEALARAQVHPRAEDRPRGHGDVLVPGLGVDAAGHAAPRVEGDVVLHGAQVGQSQRRLLGALPVLLEPAAGVAVHGKVEHQHPGDVGALGLQLLLELELRHAYPLTGPAPCSAPRSPPWPGATRPRYRGTTRWSA